MNKSTVTEISNLFDSKLESVQEASADRPSESHNLDRPSESHNPLDALILSDLNSGREALIIKEHDDKMTVPVPYHIVIRIV